MKVVCVNCNNSYSIEDSKVPEDGIKVRCPKCRRIFKVKPSKFDIEKTSWLPSEHSVKQKPPEPPTEKSSSFIKNNESKTIPKQKETPIKVPPVSAAEARGFETKTGFESTRIMSEDEQEKLIENNSPKKPSNTFSEINRIVENNLEKKILIPPDVRNPRREAFDPLLIDPDELEATNIHKDPGSSKPEDTFLRTYAEKQKKISLDGPLDDRFFSDEISIEFTNKPQENVAEKTTISIADRDDSDEQKTKKLSISSINPEKEISSFNKKDTPKINTQTESKFYGAVPEKIETKIVPPPKPETFPEPEETITDTEESQESQVKEPQKMVSVDDIKKEQKPPKQEDPIHPQKAKMKKGGLKIEKNETEKEGFLGETKVSFKDGKIKNLENNIDEEDYFGQKNFGQFKERKSGELIKSLIKFTVVLVLIISIIFIWLKRDLLLNFIASFIKKGQKFSTESLLKINVPSMQDEGEGEKNSFYDSGRYLFLFNTRKALRLAEKEFKKALEEDSENVLFKTAQIENEITLGFLGNQPSVIRNGYTKAKALLLHSKEKPDGIYRAEILYLMSTGSREDLIKAQAAINNLVKNENKQSGENYFLWGLLEKKIGKKTTAREKFEIAYDYDPDLLKALRELHAIASENIEPIALQYKERIKVIEDEYFKKYPELSEEEQSRPDIRPLRVPQKIEPRSTPKVSIQIKERPENDPNNAALFYQEGLKLMEESSYSEAKEKFKAALKLDPNNAEYNCKVGEVSQKMMSTNEARKYFEKTIELDPNIAEAYKGLGVIYGSLNENEKAVKYLEKYLSKKPNADDAPDIRAYINELK